MPPVTNEERQQSKEHPRRRPEQLQSRTSERTIDCREQLARHYYPDESRTLHTDTHGDYAPRDKPSNPIYYNIVLKVYTTKRKSAKKKNAANY